MRDGHQQIGKTRPFARVRFVRILQRYDDRCRFASFGNHRRLASLGRLMTAERDAFASRKLSVLISTNQRRSTISFLISAMALAGFRFFGQVLVQFMIV